MITSKPRMVPGILLLTCLFPLSAAAQQLDCAALENFPGLEPDGYAEACLPDYESPVGETRGRGSTDDKAFAHELRNTRNTVIHFHSDLSDSTIIGLSTSIVFGYDYDPELTTLYGINFGTGQLGTSDGIIFTPIGAPTRPQGHTWSGLAIDPVSGEAYLSSTDGIESTFQSVDLETGASTLIGNFGDLELVIEIAINCEGAMYAHDIGSDAIYQIDRSDGTPTLVGSHGLKTNFAQGMDFNNRSGELYIYAYTGGGSVTYGIVSLEDGSITPLNINDPVGEWEGASRTTCPGVGPARFRVEKDFDDNNPMDVGVSISCNTGLPLFQQSAVSEDSPVTFVVGDFIDGEPDCEITEQVPGGYTGSYDDGESTSELNCRFENVEAGSSQQCVISNTLDPVEVEVNKVWIDANPQFAAANVAGAQWFCSNVASGCDASGIGGCDSGNLAFVGNPSGDLFKVFPAWNGGTLCSVFEVDIPDGNVETDDSECAELILFPGFGASCTIYNTRLYAGIPALGPTGLAMLTMLLLTLGLLNYRR